MYIKKNQVKVIFFLLQLLVFSSYAQPANRCGFENFKDESVFDLEALKSEGFNVPWMEGFNNKRAFIDNAFSHSGNSSLRISFPRETFGPTRSGVQAPMKIKPQNQYYVSYWLRFSDNFDFGSKDEGGKLPGLGSGENCSGCVKCNGNNGFSARLGWKKDGQAILTLDEMHKKHLCGDEYALKVGNSNFFFQRGKWHHVIERVKINSGHSYDGDLEIWIDGKPVLAVAATQFVTNGTKVDNLFFSAYYDGKSSACGPSKDCSIWVDDLLITTNYSDIFAPLSLMAAQQYDSLIISPRKIKANSYIFISTMRHATIRTVELLDLSNKTVLKGNVLADTRFFIPNTNRGIYYLKINNGVDVNVRKIYIE